LHDLATLDTRGIPGCGVASEEFKPAAAAQSRSLGMSPGIVWVKHPIQNRTQPELAAMAEAAFAPIREMISEAD
tara:strand:+ start:6173 stop:6394 length:222 start_codon:yes stop_codon:yes gene_type:complete